MRMIMNEKLLTHKPTHCFLRDEGINSVMGLKKKTTTTWRKQTLFSALTGVLHTEMWPVRECFWVFFAKPGRHRGQWELACLSFPVTKRFLSHTVGNNHQLTLVATIICWWNQARVASYKFTYIQKYQKRPLRLEKWLLNLNKKKNKTKKPSCRWWFKRKKSPHHEEFPFESKAGSVSCVVATTLWFKYRTNTDVDGPSLSSSVSRHLLSWSSILKQNLEQ